MQIELTEQDLKTVLQVYLDKVFLNNVKVTEVQIPDVYDTITVELDKAPG